MVKQARTKYKQLAENVLDQYLYQGIKYKRKWVTLSSQYKPEDFDTPVISKKIDDQIELWVAEVEDWISKHLPEHHLLLHFTVPPIFAPQLKVTFGKEIRKMDLYLKALEEIILWLKEQTNLKTRLDIAELEYNAQIMYRVKFSWQTREISINNIITANPQSDSKAINFFEYVYDRPKEYIDIKTIEDICGKKLSSFIDDILDSLHFSGDRRDMFFPRTNSKKAFFMNPVTKIDMLKADLPKLRDIPLVKSGKRRKSK